jgi:hypothetical protein
MRNRIAMRVVLGAKVMPLDRPRIALALGGADDINMLAELELIDFDFGARAQFLALSGSEAKLPQPFARFDFESRKVTRLGTIEPVGLPLANRDLDGTITVTLIGLERGYTIWQRLDNGNGDRFARIRENAGHTAFTAN